MPEKTPAGRCFVVVVREERILECEVHAEDESSAVLAALRHRAEAGLATSITRALIRVYEGNIDPFADPTG